MRTIEKGAAPPCLAGLRREARRIERETGKPATASDWDPKDCGDPIREALCSEQRGLCAYCMRRIRSRGGHMKIEHFIARSSVPARMYDWDNLLGVCTGVLRGGPNGEEFTCDTARGDRPLHVHPVAEKPPPRPEDVFAFDRSGKLVVTDERAKADRDTLNLDHWRLVEGRRAVIDGLRNRLRKKDDVKEIRRLLGIMTTPTRDGLPEYAWVAIEYLRRKLRARGG